MGHGEQGVILAGVPFATHHAAVHLSLFTLIPYLSATPPPRPAPMYKADVLVTLRPSILDPQGKAVHHALGELGHASINRVRMGKYVELWIDQADEAAALAVAEAACAKLLANPVMEDVRITLSPVQPETA